MKSGPVVFNSVSSQGQFFTVYQVRVSFLKCIKSGPVLLQCIKSGPVLLQCIKLVFISAVQPDPSTEAQQCCLIMA